MWGDPHFKTVDNQNFTFNGIGEYVLVRTPSSLGLSVQTRLQRYSNNVTGTVMSAIVVKLGGVVPVQIEADNNQMNLYIAGQQHDLASSDSPLIVDSSGVMADDLSGGVSVAGGDPMAMATMTEQLFVMREEGGGFMVTTAGGVSVGTSLQSGFLGITVSLPDSYRDMTSGLLGVFNGDPDDDFTDRDGNVLQLNTEEEIYEQFGLVCKLQATSGVLMSVLLHSTFTSLTFLPPSLPPSLTPLTSLPPPLPPSLPSLPPSPPSLPPSLPHTGHVSEEESLFNYSIGAGSSYSAINDGYLEYRPLFTDEVLANASAEVLEMCQGNVECVYDSLVTGDMSVGLGTLNTSMSNDDTVQILGKHNILKTTCIQTETTSLIKS